MENGYFLKDTALTEKSHDDFHYEDYVKNLKKIIEEHDPPFNIALIGKWGVGKSSIINLLKKELEEKKEIVTHEINAWKYENESLKKAFLKNLWRTFDKNKKVSYFELLFGGSLRGTTIQATVNDKPSTPKQALKDMFQLLIVLLTLFLASSVLVLACLYIVDAINALFTPNTFSENIKDTFAAFKENIWVPIIIVPLYKMLEELIKSSAQSKVADVKLIKPIETADEYEELFRDAIAKYKKEHPDFKKLVVIVDDLDRLSTKKVVAALDAIKAFVEINECIFIVTCDENILINALEKEKLNKSPDIDGGLFLDKLFHFRLSLPPIIENDMREYALGIGRKEIPGLVRHCNGQFEEIVDILIHSEVSTPRQVKKLLNTFSNNLLIADSRESQNRKLEQKLLTGENGIKFLAKISVIQSDYNDVYMQLEKDFGYISDLMNFYQERSVEGIEIKPSIKALFIYKDSVYKIKPRYEGLMNFLTRTQHISAENLAPFIYLAQDAIGLKAGDEKQRAIRKNLISGNEIGIIDLLNEEVNPENIIFAIIEEVKYSPKNDLPSVIKASIQLIDHVNDRKKELADAISYQLATIEMKHIRFWQIEFANILEVYVKAENKVGIEKGLVFLLNELFSRSSDWKKNQGWGMNNDDFIHEISGVLELLLNNSDKLPTIIKDEVKAFLQPALDHYKFFPFKNVHTLYKNHQELFWDYFGLPFTIQLVNDMELVEKDILNVEINTFLGIAPSIIERHSLEFIKLMPVVITASPASRAMPIFRLLNPILNEIDIKIGTEIMKAIAEFSFTEQNDVEELISIVKGIPFDLKANSAFTEQLNAFILRHLPKTNSNVMDRWIDFMEDIMLREDTDFKSFSTIFNTLLKNALNECSYDEILRRLSKYFTHEQRENLFHTISSPALFYTYDSSLFNRAYTLYSLLGYDKNNISFIQGTMRQGITFFQNNQWSQNPSWASDFVKLFSVTSDKLEDVDIVNFVDALNNYAHINPDLVIKSFMHIGGHIPESRALQAINYTLNNLNSDLLRLNALEFMKTCKQFITKENNNLTLYANYLLDNFHLHVASFLEELYSKFSFITEADVIKLLTNITNLGTDKIQENLTIIKNVVEKFFSALKTDESMENVLAIILEKGVSIDLLKTILLDAFERSKIISLLTIGIQSAGKRDKYHRRKLLQLIVPYQEMLNKTNIINLLVDILREHDDTYIISICDILVHHYSDFRFGREKRNISSQMVPLFRNLNMEAKEKLLEVAKQFNIEREFEDAIKDRLLTPKEEELVFKILNFRKSRFSSILSR